MRGVTRFGVGIRHGKRERDLLHQRNVREVIADTGAGRWLDLQARAEFIEDCQLILGTLVDVFHAQLAATDVDHLRLAARDHRNLDPGFGDLLDSQAIADVEQLERLPARPEVQATIGQNAIDVQYQHTNGDGVFSWHERGVFVEA
jgi:hypothetical protein